MKKINTRALTEGAIFSAITTIIGIVTFYVPLINIFSIFWAVPIIILMYRHGAKVSLLSAVVSTILVSIFTQPLAGAELFIGFGLPGIAMGYMLRKKFGAGQIVLISGVLMAICYVGVAFLTAAVMGINLGKLIGDAFTQAKDIAQQSMNDFMWMYSAMGYTKEQLKLVMDIVDQAAATAKLLLPAMLIMTCSLLGYLNYKLLYVIMKRMGFEIPAVTPFSQWVLPDNFAITSFLAAVICFGIMKIVRLPGLDAVLTNVAYILMIVYTVMGMSVAYFFMRKYRVPKLVAIPLLIIMFAPLNTILMVLGLADIMFDLRKLNRGSAGGV